MNAYTLTHMSTYTQLSTNEYIESILARIWNLRKIKKIFTINK